MKHLIITFMAILISGCGDIINKPETFDGSSEYKARISRSHFIKDMNEEERTEFKRQFEFYFEPYTVESSLCPNGRCETKNSIESLHGLTKDETIKKISKHEKTMLEQEALILKKKRDAEIAAETKELASLHEKWIKSLGIPSESEKIFGIELSEKKTPHGKIYLEWKLRNPLDKEIRRYEVHLEIKDVNTGETAHKGYQFGNWLSPGRAQAGDFFIPSLDEYLNNDKYSIVTYVANVSFSNEAEKLFPTMDKVDENRYVHLKQKHPSEFEKINKRNPSSEPDKSARSSNSFEDLMKNFETCDIQKGLFFDPNMKKPDHTFFSENNLKPYRVEDGFAWYKINASYRGIPVVEMMIPASSWEIHSITFDLPLDEARTRIKSALGSEFRRDTKHESESRPELVEDRNDNRRSVFLCTGMS